MADESGLERTEPATSRRLEKAREEGDVPRSRELGTCLLMMAAGVGLWMVGGNLVRQIMHMLTTSFSFERSAAFDLASLTSGQIASLLDVAWALAPLGGILIVVALISPALIGGWLFSFQALIPNYGKNKSACQKNLPEAQSQSQGDSTYPG